MITKREGRWSRLRRAFIKAVDDERITPFQLIYDIIFVCAGLYLGLVAQVPPQNIEPVMGSMYYDWWLALNIVCPILTQLGRYLTAKAARTPVGEPNPALGAAWLQFTGDFGIWCVVAIYLVCVAQTAYWGQAIYAIFFVFMGVPGGFLFTLRSWRRIHQIGHRERRMMS